MVQTSGDRYCGGCPAAAHVLPPVHGLERAQASPGRVVGRGSLVPTARTRVGGAAKELACRQVHGEGTAGTPESLLTGPCGRSRLESRQDIDHVDADLADRITALENEQSRYGAGADHSAVG